MIDSSHDRFFHRRALQVFAAFSFLPLMVIGLINYVIDPFQYFRISESPRFSNAMQRYQAPGVIKNYGFDSVIVGNSVVANIQNWMFDLKGSGVRPNVMNLSLWGSTALEDAIVVKFALRTKSIKTVYWSIGRQPVTGFRFDDFPKCMYGEPYSVLPPYCYLFNLGVFWESYVHLSHSKDSRADWIEPLDKWKTYGPQRIDPHARACQMQALANSFDIDQQTREANFKPVDNAETIEYRRLIPPIVRANPNVRFVFFLTPVFLDTFWVGGVRGAVNVQRALFDVFLREPNAEVHDLSLLSSVSHNLGFFRDEAHFDTDAARLVAATLASGRLKIRSLEDHERLLREELPAGAELMRSYVREKCS
jgi:hypothetical protein